MNRPQFAERQYETAANIELARGGAAPFVPTQHLEYYLAIDAAHDPRRVRAIWRILSVNIPQRTLISPNLWPSLPRRFHDEIPGKYVSLFLQYKCDVHHDNRRAKYFARIGSPYFQVDITAHQQRRLLALEKRVASTAVVRYAAPAFWSRSDFDRHDARRQILARSAFASPSIVKTHRKWMYTSPGLDAIFNPEPEEQDGESWETIVELLDEAAQRQSLRQHIQRLAAAIAEDRTAFQGLEGIAWLARLREYGDFDGDDLRLLSNISDVAVAANEAEVLWTVLLMPDAEWISISSDSVFDRHRWNYPWW